MKKVLHLLASNKFSGAENVVCTIIENFKDEIEMAYCSPIGDIEDILKTKKINYYPIKKMSLSEIKRVVKEYKPDIIHAHDYTASVLTSFLNFKGKIISHLHNNCPFAKTWNIKTILYNLTISKYSKVIGVSNKVYDEAIFKNKLNNKYITIYNYVDKENIIKKSKEYKFDKNYDLFFFGRLTEQKDPFMFIKIVKALSKNNNQIKAVFIGDGELKEQCIKLINDYNLNNNIEFLGFVENPFPIIENCRIGIMPSKWEGFGLTAVESLILEKPILNSGVGGLGEIFKNNKEFICNSLDEYINAYQKINEINCSKISERYTDKNKFKNQLMQIYNS